MHSYKHSTLHSSLSRWWILLFLFFAFPSRDVSAQANAALTLDPVIQDHVDWFVSLVNGAEFNETEYQKRFADSFLTQVPADEFENIVNGVRQGLSSVGQDWAVTSIVMSTPDQAVVLLAPQANEPTFYLQVAVDGEGKINSILVSPSEPPTLENPPTTIEEAVARLESLGHNFAYAVADVHFGDKVNITVLMSSQEEKSAPLGSMNKLYVLGAVVDAVQAGTIQWTQQVEIVDKHKSLPTGIVQNDPPNSTRTVRELSELMISISDNSATDHLIGLVGREAVEQALRDYGHHMPELNEPFLLYREWFILKLDGTANDSNGNLVLGPTGQAYLDANVDERRVILTKLENVSVGTLNISVWTRPLEVEVLEWFGSPLDMVNVLSRLSNKDEEAARILAINPGIADEAGLWSYIGYKGGSEPGVLGMSWYLEADTEVPGRAVTGMVWDADRVIENETEATLLLSAIRDLSRDLGSNATNAPISGGQIALGPMTMLLASVTALHFLFPCFC